VKGPSPCPGKQEDAEVSAIDDAIAIEVCFALRTFPLQEEEPDVGTINGSISVEVSGRAA
jgi:hypothetical protein